MTKIAEITYSSIVIALFTTFAFVMGVMVLHTLAVVGRLAEAILRAVGIY